jgi:hypothetical protein
MRTLVDTSRLRFEDLAPFAEARHLARHVRQLALAAHDDFARASLADLTTVARATLASVTEAMHAGDPHLELRGFRDAQVLLGEVRTRAYRAFLGDALDGSRFDQLMADAARTARELERAAQSARQRARQRIDEA